ncbi:MAG: prepilin peptidase [Deltaproteobacteria bacterium HGW-Deltaproteobacteria-19]|jgi:leader peptidase (prepilin peptidase)/N-methyltransferase|nr:MAG: prepilin peptidase [Deltaproteobacteria bacterium HGW-Deltaproteobacteria-19]
MAVFMDIFITVAAACVGSFLNVCIARMPVEGQSIVKPASRCPRCGHPIRMYDNIPIVSWLILRGKCRDCGEPISFRYPLVEGLTAILGLTLFKLFGLGLPFLAAFLFVSALVVITFIDLDHQIIPHAITLPGIPICFLMAVFIMRIPAVDSFLGIMIGAGTLYFVAVYFEAITGREGMGGGDVNLLAMMGAFFGWKSLLFIILMSSFTGAIAGLGYILLKKKDRATPIPFGPFLCLGALGYLFAGDAFFRWLLTQS